MLNVFITVDTEIWPFAENWPRTPLPPSKRDFAREYNLYVRGRTPEGEFGVPFQVDAFRRFGLRANYFIEALGADVYGHDMLRDIVALVGSAHDVQLHLHTEWLGDIQGSRLPKPFRQHLRYFSEAEQTSIISHGITSLVQAGALRPNTLRAGNYGANRDTLRAARNCGLTFDTSYDYCYLGTSCGIEGDASVLQPFSIEGIREFPISFFQDYPGHYRHAQLCACSFPEVSSAMLDAWRAGWHVFVVVLHSFELIKMARARAGRLEPDATNVRRFTRLCEFLDSNRDKFATRGFSEIEPDELVESRVTRGLRSRPHHTTMRVLEQALSRFV